MKLIALNDTPCGTIPREPEPRPRSGSPIRTIVGPLGAAAGVVFNSDLSRMGIVTDAGEPLSEEMSYPLVADYVLGKLPKGVRVVTNVCTTRTLDDVASGHGRDSREVAVGRVGGGSCAFDRRGAGGGGERRLHDFRAGAASTAS